MWLGERQGPKDAGGRLLVVVLFVIVRVSLPFSVHKESAHLHKSVSICSQIAKREKRN